MLKHFFTLALALFMTGCLVSVDSDSRSLERTWNSVDVGRLQVGSSDTSWVQSTFGDPVTKLKYADGTEIWKFRNRSEKDTEVGLIFLLSVDLEEEHIETLSIEFDGGIVSNYWVEEDRF